MLSQLQTDYKLIKQKLRLNNHAHTHTYFAHNLTNLEASIHNLNDYFLGTLKLDMNLIMDEQTHILHDSCMN